MKSAKSGFLVCVFQEVARVTLVSAWILSSSIPVRAQNGLDAGPGLSIGFTAAPTYYRYEESGKGLFAGLKTNWESFAFLGMVEGRYTTAMGLVPLLRFSGLTTATAEESNNQGAPTTDMQVQYFFNLQPALQYQFRPIASMVLAPEFAWDWDWYQQSRQTVFGDVDEAVFWQGPAIGGQFTYALASSWAIDLQYRHSFLFDVSAHNDFLHNFGIDDASTDGNRDVLHLQAVHSLNPRWDLVFGYRFESARINAGDTQTVFVGTPVTAQFPDNEHTLHSLQIGFRVAL